MKPHKALEVLPEDWLLFADIRRAIENLPKILVGPAFVHGMELPLEEAENKFIPNCHIMCRALANIFPVEVHEGAVGEHRYGRYIRHEHSWLTRQGGDGKIIIDPWPLGSLSGPMLTIQDYCFHYGNESSSLEHRYSKKFASQVRVTTEALQGKFRTPDKSFEPLFEVV